MILTRFTDEGTCDFERNRFSPGGLVMIRCGFPAVQVSTNTETGETTRLCAHHAARPRLLV